MQNLVRFSLAQRVFFNCVFVLMIMVGAFALTTLPIERYPFVNMGQMVISTYFPGASPDEVETLVTREIEDALEDLEEVDFIRSTSYRERSSIMVKFNDDTDYNEYYKDTRFKVLGIMNDLPQTVDPPYFVEISTKEWLPVLSVNLFGQRSNRALTLMAEELKLELARIPGVEKVDLQGEFVREFHIYVDPARLALLGVTFDQVAEALRAANVSVPAGDYTDGSGEFVVKVDETFRSRQDVMETIVRKDADGSFVRVADLVSGAGFGHRDPGVMSSVNGLSAVTLRIVKKNEGNALDVAKGVRQALIAFAPVLEREDVGYVYTQDSTVYIEDSIQTLGANLLVGIVLVSLILWYFMGIRNAGLTTIGIPFSFLFTMVLMKATGNSLNEITLFSFVLVSGIIVDDAIVVVENIYRHIQEGAQLREAIINGTSEVFLPVVSATLTTVAAFLPMLIMTGTTGEFFAQVPKAVSFALAASVFECLLLIPIHYFDFGPRCRARCAPGEAPEPEPDNLILHMARWLTLKVTWFTMRFRLLSLGLVLGLFAVAMGILLISITGRAPLIRIQFFPDDYKLYYAILEGPPSTPIEELDAKCKAVSEFIMADGPGAADSAMGFAGFYTSEDYEEIYGHNLGQVVVTLPARADQDFPDNPDNDALQHLEYMRKRLKDRFETDGYRVKVRAEKDGPPTGKDFTVRVLGASLENVEGLAAELMAFIRADPRIGPHLVDLEDNQGQPNRVFRLGVKKERAAEYGLTPAAVAGLAGSVLDGRYIGHFRLPDEEIDLKLRVTPDWLASPEKSLDIPVVEHPTGPVRLGDLCRVETYIEPGYLNRYNRERAIAIQANLGEGAPTSAPAINALVREHYQSVRADYPGAGILFGGEHEDTKRSFTSLTYAFVIAVMLIYLILASQFQSYVQPLIILSAVVFSLIGVIFGKFVTQSLFTVNSFIAVVGVTGVVVNDSLVLIDFINKAYARGLSRREAIAEGIRVRLRPILLTTLTTTLGLLPMAVGFPYYSLVWGSMASTFVTGLFTATMLTLFIVPVEWDILMQFLEWRERRRGRGRDQGREASETEVSEA